MKIEMGESLFYSWLRHVKECQIVQTNWTTSGQWSLLHEDKLEEIKNLTDRHFKEKYGYDLYKKTTSLSQLLQQAESDALGISLQAGGNKVYAVDVAFHEAGVSYGDRESTIMKIVRMCLRTAMCIYGYLDTREAEIIFASPKINKSVLVGVVPCLADAQKILDDLCFHFRLRIIANEDFREKVLEPILLVSDGVADTNELFLRSYQMLQIKSPCGVDRWPHSTVRSMLKNEKFAGDLLLQKSFIEDFLTKKCVKNEGQFPQYYVENAHPPIVPKEVFMRVQGELLRQENEKQAGKATRQRCRNALFGLIHCGECGERYRRYKDRENVKWRCGKRVSERNSCSGVSEDEVIHAVVSAFNSLPEKRDDIIRMQERILWGPLEETNREIDAIDKRKNELEGIISDYVTSGHLDRRTLFLYSDEDEEMDEEKAVDRISMELEALDEKRNVLLIRKGDLGIQEANLHTLLKLVNGIMMKGEQREILMTGTDNVAITVEKSPACYDLVDFYERTDRITQWGTVTGYDNDLVRRYVEKVVVKADGLEIKFKAGINVKAEK